MTRLRISRQQLTTVRTAGGSVPALGKSDLVTGTLSAAPYHSTTAGISRLALRLSLSTARIAMSESARLAIHTFSISPLRRSRIRRISDVRSSALSRNSRKARVAAGGRHDDTTYPDTRY